MKMLRQRLIHFLFHVFATMMTMMTQLLHPLQKRKSVMTQRKTTMKPRERATQFLLHQMQIMIEKALIC